MRSLLVCVCVCVCTQACVCFQLQLVEQELSCSGPAPSGTKRGMKEKDKKMKMEKVKDRCYLSGCLCMFYLCGSFQAANTSTFLRRFKIKEYLASVTRKTRCIQNRRVTRTRDISSLYCHPSPVLSTGDGSHLLFTPFGCQLYTKINLQPCCPSTRSQHSPFISCMLQ